MILKPDTVYKVIEDELCIFKTKTTSGGIGGGIVCEDIFVSSGSLERNWSFESVYKNHPEELCSIQDFPDLYPEYHL